jgi:hypothetical protein
VQRIRYQNLYDSPSSGKWMLIASTKADSNGIITALNIQSLTMTGTDINKWDHGI